MLTFKLFTILRVKDHQTTARRPVGNIAYLIAVRTERICGQSACAIAIAHFPSVQIKHGEGQGHLLHQRVRCGVLFQYGVQNRVTHSNCNLIFIFHSRWLLRVLAVRLRQVSRLFRFLRSRRGFRLGLLRGLGHGRRGLRLICGSGCAAGGQNAERQRRQKNGKTMLHKTPLF